MSREANMRDKRWIGPGHSIVYSTERLVLLKKGIVYCCSVRVFLLLFWFVAALIGRATHRALGERTPVM